MATQLTNEAEHLGGWGALHCIQTDLRGNRKVCDEGMRGFARVAIRRSVEVVVCDEEV